MPEPTAFGLVILSAFLVMTPNGASAQTQTSFCAIDMGSNTFRRIVGTFANGRYEQRTFGQTLGVGDNVAEKWRNQRGQARGDRGDAQGLQEGVRWRARRASSAIGTWAFRAAPNGQRAVEIAAAHGVAMEIASEAREAELAYLAGSLGRDDVAVIDNGSRSIELASRGRWRPAPRRIRPGLSDGVRDVLCPGRGCGRGGARVSRAAAARGSQGALHEGQTVSRGCRIR